MCPLCLMFLLRKFYSVLHKRKGYHSKIKTSIINDKLWGENRKKDKRKSWRQISGLFVFQNPILLLIYGF